MDGGARRQIEDVHRPIYMELPTSAVVADAVRNSSKAPHFDGQKILATRVERSRGNNYEVPFLHRKVNCIVRN